MKLQDCTLLSRFSKPYSLPVFSYFRSRWSHRLRLSSPSMLPEQPDRGPSLSVSIGPG